MKKIKYLLALLILSSVSMLSGCDSSGSNGTSQIPVCNHTFSSTYSYDESNHWKQATCDHNLTAELAPHTFDANNTCLICNYKKQANEGHTHTFSSTYSFNESNHWKEATCEHNLTSEFATHSFNSNDICSTCGYKKPESASTHNHSFSSVYTYDESNHWKQATCEHTNLTSELASHSFNSSNKCTVCGYTKQAESSTHSHSFSETYSNDENYHWKQATCEHTNLSSNLALHTFGVDNKCSICGFEKEAEVITHSHTFASMYTFDNLSHWKIATCGHNNLTIDFANHVFGDDNICDVCQYVKTLDPIKVHKIELDKEEYSLKMFEEEQVLVTVTPNDAENKQVVWSSLDDSIASIVNGKIHPNGVGETYIVATSTDGSNVQSFAKVIVTDGVCTDITLKETKTTIKYGGTYKLEISPSPSGISLNDIRMTSNDENIATIDQNGLISAVGIGTTDIEITSLSNPSLVKSFEVTVDGTPIKAFRISLDEYQMNVGETYQIKPQFIPSFTSNKDIVFVSIDESVATVDDNGLVTAVAPGFVTISAITVDGHLSDHLSLNVVENELNKVELDYTLRDYYDHAIDEFDCASSFQKMNTLVIPVWFTDSSTYIDADHKESVRNDIETVHFGTNEETGWRTVANFYEEESFDNLDFGGMVTDWYEPNQSSEFYGGSREKVTELTDSAVAWAKETYNSVDWDDYDCDANGFFDSVEIIFGVPDYSSTGKSSLTLLGTSAYRIAGRVPNYSEPIVSQYTFASYDYMYYKGDKALQHTGLCSYGKGCAYVNVTLDAHDYIHEVGHMFGLEEMSNANGGPRPLGQFSMQDLKLGMHDPFSLLALGWVKPYIPTESMTITLAPFESSGDMVILSPEFHNSPFDEYMILTYYKSSGLNDIDSNVGLYGPIENGGALYHIDARLAKGMSKTHMPIDGLTVNPITSGGEKVNFAFNNTTYSSGGSSCGLFGQNYGYYYRVQYIRNNTTFDYKTTGNMNSASLFKKGSSFSMERLSKQFVNGTKLNSGLDLGWTFTIDSITDSGMTVTLTKAA